ncbi:FtsX-like permease family protein [Clostridium ihumii]|uniref:FtsX-like permease family protein n=1 Tax=Clostridium ihumii TaxID=1470356 RepID=UPI00058BBEE2|nr:ABC transporter permease [Clostridium ihumii]
MYIKLSLNNAKKSIKDYLIYFITITMCVSLFYAFTSLSSSNYNLITEDSYNFEFLKTVLKYSTYIITGILSLLVAYVSKYMIRRRQKEFATYILLGVEQRNIAFMFFVEMLLVGILAIVCGIFIGILFSQVVTAMVYMSVNQKVVFSFNFYFDTVIKTFIFFIGMFFIVGIYNIRVLNKLKLIDMINNSKISEFKFKRSKMVYSIVFMLSIIAYGIFGYSTKYILDIKKLANESNYTASAIKMMMAEGVSVISFVIATYALFYSISYILIRIKEKSINFKYEGTNLFLLGTILSKIRTTPMLMATVSIAFLGSSISIILTLLMSQWSLGYLDYRIPFDIELRSGSYSYRIDENSNTNKIGDMANFNYSELINHLKDLGVELNEYEEVEKYFAKEEDFYKKDIKSTAPFIISLSDFNKLRSMQGYDKVSLKNNEYTVQWDKMTDKGQIDKYVNENKTINIKGNDLRISEKPYYLEVLGEGIYNYPATNIIIIPDKLCEKLKVAEVDLFITTNNEMSYDDAYEFEAKYIPTWFSNNNPELMKKYDSPEKFIKGRIKSAETSEILNASLAMRILGLYLGAVLLMISLTVLALQQLMDSIEHKDRFNVLRKLGIEEHQINKIILKQIGIYFTIPIVIGTIAFVVFIYNYYIMYEELIKVFIGSNMFVVNMSIGIFLMIMLYVSYFVGTYYTFKRNIRADNRA